MRLYLVQIPPTRDQGSHVMRFMCNRSQVRKEALWEYNDTRARDYLPAVRRLPVNTSITRAIA
jgi:hypothetical protein